MKCYNEATTMAMCGELKAALEKKREMRGFDADLYISKKVRKLNAYMAKSGLNACVVAVSGGIDSAVVLALAKKASEVPDSPIKKIVAMLLPCMENTGVTNQEDATRRGREVCEAYGIAPTVLNMQDIVTRIRGDVESVLGLTTDDWAVGQLVPYSRTPVLYYTTSLLNVAGYKPVLLGTTNFSEGGYLGYVGKASDGMVDVQVISDLYKSEVYAVAEALNVPASVMNVTPAGDMYDSRVDEEVFGAPYDFVELYMEMFRGSQPERWAIINGLSKEAMAQYEEYAGNLENLHRYNGHKYLCGSPAVHIDLWESNVPGGWHNTAWEG